MGVVGTLTTRLIERVHTVGPTVGTPRIQGEYSKGFLVVIQPTKQNYYHKLNI